MKLEVISPWSERNGLEVQVERRPPFDCLLGFCLIDGCPGGSLGMKSHGRGSAQYFWSVRGKDVGVRWSWFADEHLPETIEELDRTRVFPGWRSYYPSGAAVSYHSATPAYEHQERGSTATTACDLIGVPCYDDVSFTASDEALNLLFTEGEDAAWDWLEERWRGWFEDVLSYSKTTSRESDNE